MRINARQTLVRILIILFFFTSFPAKCRASMIGENIRESHGASWNGQITYMFDNAPISLFTQASASTNNGDTRKSSDGFSGYPFKEIIFLLLLLPIAFIIIDWIMAAIGPFWWFERNISLYSETRMFPPHQVNIAYIMSMDFTKTKTYAVKKWPEHNALTFRAIRVNISQNKDGAYSAILYFKQTPNGTELNLVSKMHALSLLLPIMLLVLIIPMIIDLAGSSTGDLNVFSYAMIALILISLPALYAATVKTAKRQSRELLDLALIVFGIEKPPDVKTLL